MDNALSGLSLLVCSSHLLWESNTQRMTNVQLSSNRQLFGDVADYDIGIPFSFYTPAGPKLGV